MKIRVGSNSGVLGKVLVFALAFLMAAGLGITPISDAVYAESLSASDLTVEQTGAKAVAQEEECTLSFKITNATDSEVSYDSAEVEFSDGKDITVSGGQTGSVTLAKKGSQATVTFDLSASRYSETGSQKYCLILKKGEDIVYESKYFQIDITAKQSTPATTGYYVSTIEMYADTTPSDGFKTGKGNSIAFELYNSGNSTVKAMQLTLTLPDGVVVQQGSNQINVGIMRSGDRKNVSFPIVVEEGLEKKSYVITATIKGSNNLGDAVEVSKSFYVYVDGSKKKGEEDKEKEEEKDEGIKTPQLMVSNYHIGGSTVQAGTSFSLGLDVHNTSDKDLRNIKVTVSSDGTFVPVGSSSSFFVDAIAAKGTYSQALTLSTSLEAEQKITALTVSMAYEDTKGNAYTSEDTISIPVTQETRLVVDELVPPTELYMGNAGSASLDFYNMGKTTLSNLRVNASGNFDIMESNSYYAGNMASGGKDSYSFSFVPREVGPMEGVVTFTYEDATGSQQYLEVPFTFEVMEMPVWDDGTDVIEEPVEEDTTPKKAIIIGGAILAALVLFFIIKKIRKRKMQKALELEDME